jgi:hypothetical protein
MYSFVKMYEQPTNALQFYDVFYSQYVNEHVSASSPAIFRVMLQDYNCS